MSDRLAELIQLTEENLVAVRERIKFHRPNYSYQDYIEKAGLTSIDETRFSKFVNGGNISIANYERIVRYLYENKLWQTRDFCKEVQRIDDPLYHSLIAFLSIGIGTEDNIRLRAQGLYRLYRPSIVVPHSYIRGYLNIWYDDISCSVKTMEVQIYSGKDGSRPKREEYHGYLIRKNRTYVILSRDKAISSIQMTMFPYSFREETDVATMSGLVVGSFENKPFSSRIYVERYDGVIENLEESSDICHETEIPSSIVANLREEVPTEVTLY